MPDSKKSEELAGRRRAAAFLLSLDPETAAMLMAKLSEGEVSLLTEEMSRFGELTGATVERLFKEFSRATGRDVIAVQPAALALIERAIGKERAAALFNQGTTITSSGPVPFRSLQELDAQRIASLLKGEHPQVVALIVSHLPPATASALIKSLDEETRFEVVKRVAGSEELPPELVRQVDAMMEARAAGMRAGAAAAQSGANRFKTVAQMLNVSEPALSKSIMDRLNRDSPQVAGEIAALMFVFEDLLKIPDRDMQKVLGEIDKNDLALALRAATPEMSTKLLANLSSRARDNLKEEMEMMGAKPLSEITEAQKRILQQVRAMEEKGDIKINRGTSEAMV